MSLVHTCGSLADGEPRFRNFIRYDKVRKTVVRRRYRLDQPQVHATYRDKFWHVDRFNKLALGPKSIQYVLKTNDWRVRMFLALLAISETNAWLLQNAMLERQGLTPVSHVDFRAQLV